LLVGGVNVVMALALIAYSQQPLSWKTVLMAIGCGIAGGLLTAVFAAGGLPINESLFGILTDVKLLELSNADLPVLGQLALRAPGTNQHSHAVGQLAEDACRAVGANPLLARIGALYHDIGKLAAPEYFVENQQGNNPHDRLRPYQSAKIITSHVTYGARLAKEIGLPQKIADFIPQHHGTRTLHYFLRKAQAQAKPNEKIDEADFRYPGPKPQFKEAAIMMLADSCEAAARSLARPDPENIRAIVVKIVDAIISDGQLDECDITLQELTTIREAMISALTAIYHARIDYPGFNLRIAKWAKKQNLRIIFYISPQVWAWKENRVKMMKECIDKMLVILPFEKEYYKNKWNWEVEYVGHPLVEVIDQFKVESLKLKTQENLPTIALLPGSRKQEIAKKLPIMLEAVQSFPDYQFVIAQAPSLDESFYKTFTDPYPNVSSVKNKTYDLLMKSKAALVTSGTATLETALFGVPEVVCYKGSQVSYQIAKRLIKVKYISLVNLIMDKLVVHELIQNELTPVNLVKELQQLLTDPVRINELKKDYADLKRLLSEGGNASAKAAKSIVGFLN